MTKLPQYLLIVFTLLLGCKNVKYKDPSQKAPSTSWLYVSIKANGKEFPISDYDDTLAVNTSSINNSDFIKKTRMSKSDKDSLYKWTETMLQSKLVPTAFCTDYFGKLTLRIDYSEQLSRQIEYRSICEWQNLDSNTLKMYKLLIKYLIRSDRPAT